MAVVNMTPSLKCAATKANGQPCGQKALNSSTVCIYHTSDPTAARRPKQCGKCGAPGPFSKNRAKKDGLASYCTPCQVEVGAPSRHSEKGRARSRVHAKEQQAERQAFWNAYKLIMGCADCGTRRHVALLQFDHVYGTKNFDMADAARLSKWKCITEALKCDVVCGNCHALRTIERGGPRTHKFTVGGLPLPVIHHIIRDAVQDVGLSAQEHDQFFAAIRTEMLKVTALGDDWESYLDDKKDLIQQADLVCP